MFDAESNTAGPIPTEDSPVSGTLTPPAAQAPALPVLTSSQPSQAPSATSPNRRLHNFVGSVLGALAGPPPTQYTTDQNGRLTPLATPPETATTKMKRIANNAIGGLSAGAAVPPQKSGLANALAGFGAGADFVSGKRSGDEALSKDEARKNFEAEQRATLQKYEIAKANALNYKLYFDNLKNQNDMDPVRKQNAEIAEAFKAMPDHDVQEMSGAAARAAMQDPQNPVFAHTHLVLPGGFRAVVDENGNPVKDAQGNPKSEGFVYVVGGMKDGKIALPGSLIDDAKKYGALGGVTGAERLTEGLEMDASAFIKLYNGVNAGKVAAAKGWANPDLSENKDGNIIQHNLVTGEQKPATAAQTQKFQMDKAGLAEKQQQTRTGRSTEIKNLAEAEKARREGSQDADDVQSQGIDLVEGDMDPSLLNKRSKSYNTVLKSARDYSMQKYGKPFDVAKAASDYKFATNVQTQNVLKYLNSLTGADNQSGNLQALINASDKINRTEFPPLNDLSAWLKITSGDPQMAGYKTAVLEVADQAAKILQGGGSGSGTSDAKLKQAQELFDVKFTKDQTREISNTLRTLLANRKKEMIGDNRYLLRQYGTPVAQPQSEPAGWTHKATAADGKTTIYLMPGGAIQDAQGNSYSNKGERIK